jgi:O-antigen ligase
VTQAAVVAGALGAVALLLARRPAELAAGTILMLVAAGALGVASLGIGLPAAGSAVVAGAALAAIIVVGVAAALFVRFPQAIVPALLVAAPLRLPLAADASNPLILGFVRQGGLGRLYPLYAVLAPALCATLWHALRGAPARPLPRPIAVPAAILVALATLSALWSADPRGSADALVFFWLPFTLLLAVVAQAPVRDRTARVLGTVVVAVAALFAAIGIWQAVTEQLFFFTPQLAVVNEHGPLFRVTSVFQDPSHFGRYLVVGIATVFVALWLDRLRVATGAAVVALLAAGLWFSYSQSSMVALVVVLLAVALAAGDRGGRRVAVAVCLVLVLAGIAGLGYGLARGDLAELTRERSRLALDTAEVALAHPLTGVGLGAQAPVTRAEQNPDQNVDRNASHTTPLTVAAELGLPGLAAYLALLAGTAVVLIGLRRREPVLALGIGAVLLTLLVHSLMYAGFFDNPMVWGAIGLAAGALAQRAPPGALGTPRPAEGGT